MKKISQIAIIALILIVLGFSVLAVKAQSNQNAIKTQMQTKEGREQRDIRLYHIAKQRRDNLVKSRAMSLRSNSHK